MSRFLSLPLVHPPRKLKISYYHSPPHPQHRQVLSSFSLNLACYLIPPFLPFRDKILKSNGIRDMTRFFNAQFGSVTQSCPTLCDPVNCSMPGLPVHHQLPEFTQTHVHWVGDAIQPSHPLSFLSPPALNLSQHQCLFKWVGFSYQVAKVLEFQLQK